MAKTMQQTAAGRSARRIDAPAAKPRRSPRLRVDLVDIRQSSVQQVLIWAENGMLQIAGPGLLKQIPWSTIDWQAPSRPDAQRTVRLPDGSALCAIQISAWDNWCSQMIRAPLDPATPWPWARLWPLAAASLAALMLSFWAWPWLPHGH